MNSPRLNLTQTPPLAVPLRFFLTAPWFGVVAGLLLAAAGPSALASRWTPAALAMTHLLVLGLITMTMWGALLQLFPVLLGTGIPRPRSAAAVFHGLLTLGVVLLAAGLWRPAPTLVAAGAAALVAAVVSFVVLAGYAVCRSGWRSLSARVFAAGLGALAVAAGLGSTLAAGHAGAPFGILRSLTDLHAAWGLLGWIAAVVMGVAFQVVPMFYAARGYPRALTAALSAAVLAALLGMSAASTAPAAAGIALPAGALAAAALSVFALWTLGLQSRRLRSRPDVPLQLWRTAMGSLLGASILWALCRVWDIPVLSERLPELLGALYIVGFAASLVNAMLYKIVPFLIWLHLTQLRGARRVRGAVPHMGSIIPERHMRWQFRAQTGALLALIMAVLWPQPWAYPAGVLLALGWFGLWLNIFKAAQLHRRAAAVDDGWWEAPSRARST
ncbi:MAG TPA: hypothetical protein VKA14_05230 [Gammaproteobacteria bacterium]|nr:hypothetical protein [Gammaproteobacteria bacterium]